MEIYKHENHGPKSSCNNEVTPITPVINWKSAPANELVKYLTETLCIWGEVLMWWCGYLPHIVISSLVDLHCTVPVTALAHKGICALSWSSGYETGLASC
jgi:hypothetical protein